MIDHLLRFNTEAAAQGDPVVGRYWTPASGDGPGAWRGDVCIPGVSCYAVTGTETVTDPQTGQSYQREVRSVFPGWWIVIALATLDPALRDLPGGACRLIADRDAAGRGETFVRYLASDIDPASLAASRVEPSFAGSDYPFGQK